MRLLRELNDAQRQAVEAGDGPVLIIAGPGTGKTKTLTARIAYLLETQAAKPSEIVALTFTNKAAREMRERLATLLGKGTKLPKICTFHALGHDLIKIDGNAQKLVGEAERLEIIRSLSRPQALKGAGLRELSLVISRAKTSISDTQKLSSSGLTRESSPKGIHQPADANATGFRLAGRNDSGNEAVTRLVADYEKALAAQDLYDFDDLLLKTYNMLKSDEAKRPRYRYVLVDEFQDTSQLQYELLKLLGASENVFAIGDPNQSIYSWRGAGAEMFERLRHDFLDIETIDLTQNYRSRPQIITLANTIFPDSPQLVAQTEVAGKVQALQTLNEYSEAAYVIGEIEKGIGGSDFLKAHADGEARQPRDYAVLYRTHQAGRTLQKVFAESGVPFQIAGEGSPYEQTDVQAIIAELRKLPDSKGPVCDAAAQLAQKLGFQTENLGQLLGMLVQFGTDVTAALKHLDDIAEQEFYDPTVNAVTLMTIHASKGLEFNHVFLVAAEEGVLPKINKTSDPNIDEERRLFYVAATRAKDTLEAIHAKTRSSQPAEPSRFIVALPESVLPRTIDPNMQALEKRQQRRQQKRAQTSLF